MGYKFFLIAIAIIAIIGIGAAFLSDKEQAFVPASIAKPAEQNNIVQNPAKDEALSKIKNKNFQLVGVPQGITFEEAVNTANYVSSQVSIRPAFLLGVLQQEFSLVDKYGLCYLTNLENGDGIKITGGRILPKTMKPGRDIPVFLKITERLGKDPLKTLVTCPMSFGWGGAMGPADFIPSTWELFSAQIEKITGKPSDPWDTKDAFLAAGLYLSESGANSKTEKGEWDSAMVYFSGSINSPYKWYADSALKFAGKIQEDINALESL